MTLRETMRLRDTLVGLTPWAPKSASYAELVTRLEAHTGERVAPQVIAGSLQRALHAGLLCRVGARYARPQIKGPSHLSQTPAQ